LAPEFNLTNNTSSIYHRYNKPFVLEEFQVSKNILGDNVLVKVSRAGICRIDLQLLTRILKNTILLNYHKA
jgi:D-arabinose 1-dehydrogenase-like Zn-dependent alcohol dehydrogenase